MSSQPTDASTPAGRVAKKPAQISRRKLLRMLTVSGGVVAGSTLLPEKWARPVVEVGLLPAHAQTSPGAPPTAISEPLQTTE